MTALIYNGVGIIGDFCILFAYFMLQWGRFEAHRLPYLLFNLLGALCLLFTLIFEWNFSVLIIELAWVAISIFGIYRAIHSRLTA